MAASARRAVPGQRRVLAAEVLPPSARPAHGLSADRALLPFWRHWGHLAYSAHHFIRYHHSFRCADLTREGPFTEAAFCVLLLPNPISFERFL